MTDDAEISRIAGQYLAGLKAKGHKIFRGNDGRIVVRPPPDGIVLQVVRSRTLGEEGKGGYPLPNRRSYTFQDEAAIYRHVMRIVPPPEPATADDQIDHPEDYIFRDMTYSETPAPADVVRIVAMVIAEYEDEGCTVTRGEDGRTIVKSPHPGGDRVYENDLEIYEMFWVQWVFSRQNDRARAALPPPEPDDDFPF